MKFATFACLAYLSAVASADSLIRNAPQAVTGTFLRATPFSVAFSTGDVVPWSQVAGLSISHSVVVRTRHAILPDGRDILALAAPLTVSLAGPATVSITRPGAPAITVPLSELISIEPNTWLLSITPKATLTSSTQIQQTFGGNLLFDFAQNADRGAFHHRVTYLNLDANSMFSAKPGASPVHSHRYDGQLSERFYIARRAYLSTDAEQYHNNSLNLYLQQSYGGDIHTEVFDKRSETGKQGAALSLGCDGRYFAEHFYGPTPGAKFWGIQPRQELTIIVATLKGLPVVVGEQGQFMRPIDYAKAWQAHGGITFSLPITKNFKYNTSWIDDYLENAPNARKNYSTVTVGISLSITGSQ